MPCAYFYPFSFVLAIVVALFSFPASHPHSHPHTAPAVVPCQSYIDAHVQRQVHEVGIRFRHSQLDEGGEEVG